MSKLVSVDNFVATSAVELSGTQLPSVMSIAIIFYITFCIVFTVVTLNIKVI